MERVLSWVPILYVQDLYMFLFIAFSSVLPMYISTRASIESPMFFQLQYLITNFEKVKKNMKGLGLDVNFICLSRKIYKTILQDVSPPQNLVSSPYMVHYRTLHLIIDSFWHSLYKIFYLYLRINKTNILPSSILRDLCNHIYFYIALLLASLLFNNFVL